tara:strand:- start:3256 stop:4272 length:1017 start_codon:yes stop_codon:yes gene_type:complete
MWFKREDAFAPLGYGGINGTKLRQLIWLVKRYRDAGGSAGLVSGASVLSPQLAMGAAVSKHFEIPCTLAVGATHPDACMRNPMVRLAVWLGAKLDFHAKTAYNPSLQQRCRTLLSSSKQGWFYLEYGITLDHAVHEDQAVLDFHRVGALQTQNIPDHITDLVIPAGSCNSATSILHGLAMDKPKPMLTDIRLVGIGPTKMRLISERLAVFEKLTGVNHRIWQPMFETDLPSFAPQGEPRYRLHYDDLQGGRLVRYHTAIPFSYAGIVFHPTYEGKVMAWLSLCRRSLIKPTTLFWIIGSEPDLALLRPYLEKECGRCPTVAPVDDGSKHKDQECHLNT